MVDPPITNLKSSIALKCNDLFSENRSKPTPSNYLSGSAHSDFLAATEVRGSINKCTMDQ